MSKEVIKPEWPVPVFLRCVSDTATRRVLVIHASKPEEPGIWPGDDRDEGAGKWPLRELSGGIALFSHDSSS